jgi:hypothetical protein
MLYIDISYIHVFRYCTLTVLKKKGVMHLFYEWVLSMYRGFMTFCYYVFVHIYIHVLRFCCNLTHPLYFIWVCVFMIYMPAFILWMYRGFMTFCCYVFVRNDLRFCCNLTHPLYFIWVCFFIIDMTACVLLSKCNIDLFYICRPLAGYGFMEWTINNYNNWYKT